MTQCSSSAIATTTIQRDTTKIKTLSDYSFFDENHNKDLLQGLNALRKMGTFCDVTLKVCNEHRGFLAHRQVLAALSPYFKALYVGEETKSLHQDTMLQGLSTAALETVVNYVYTGSAVLTAENASEILQASVLLQLQSLRIVCEGYLRKCISSQNCLQLVLFTEKHGCRELSVKAREFVSSNFAEVVDQDEFLNMEGKTLKEIISSDCLMIEREYEVYLAVKKWIEHDREKRLKYVPMLMSQVRFRLMPREFLNASYLQESIMSISPLSRDFVHEALQYEKLPVDERRNVHTSRVKPRWCTQSLDVISLVGGVSLENEIRGPLHWAFDPVKNQWYTASPLLSPRYHFGLTQWNGKLYVFGGSANEGFDRFVATVEIYEPKLNQWKSVARTMKEARSRFDAVAIEEIIVLVGGMCNDPHRNTLEIFRPTLIEERHEETGACSDRLQVPKDPRYNHCTAVLNGKIYFIGGCTRGHSILKAVECYDPGQNTWSNVAPLQVARSGACAVIIDDRIVVIGGSNEKKPLNSCEVYNSNQDRWEFIASMNERRDHCTGVCFREKIYVFGGSYGQVIHNSVECYTAKTNKWKVVSHLPASSHGFKCTTSVVNQSLVEPICFEQV